MSAKIRITVNGTPIEVPEGSKVNGCFSNGTFAKVLDDPDATSIYDGFNIRVNGEFKRNCYTDLKDGDELLIVRDKKTGFVAVTTPKK